MKPVLAALLVAVLTAPAAYAKADYHGLPPAGAAAKGASLVAVCAACHGSNGISVSAAYPNLAGQQYNYILKQLENFRSGARKNAIMSTMAMTIPPAKAHANLKDIAAFFSRLTPMWVHPASPAGAAPAAQQIELGRAIYDRGVAGKDIPSCAACHGLGGEGNGPMAIPVLAGQHAAYVVTQLEQFASGARHNSPGHVMHTIARAMNAAQEAAVAAYVRQLDPATTLGIGPKDLRAYAKALAASGAVDRKAAGKPTSAASGAAGAGAAAH
jgi:cytochrome c553